MRWEGCLAFPHSYRLLDSVLIHVQVAAVSEVANGQVKQLSLRYKTPAGIKYKETRPLGIVHALCPVICLSSFPFNVGSEVSLRAYDSFDAIKSPTQAHALIRILTDILPTLKSMA